MIRGCLLLLVGYLAVGAQSLYAETDDDVLTIVLQGYRQAISSVQSGKGRVVVSVAFDKSSGGQVETETIYDVAFSGARFAFRAAETYLKNDPSPGDDATLLIRAGSLLRSDASFDGQKAYLLLPDKAKGYIADPTTNQGKVVSAEYKRVAIWGRDLLKLDTNVQALARQPRIAGREVLPDGDECIIVEFTWTDKLPSGEDATQCVWFWVDPQKGFVVPRIRSWSRGGIYKEKTLTSESTIEFRRYGDSLWVPSKITYDEYRLSRETGEPKRISRDVVTYDPGFQINVPVPDSELGPVRFPSGTRVLNEILDAEYKEP